MRGVQFTYKKNTSNVLNDPLGQLGSLYNWRHAEDVGNSVAETYRVGAKSKVHGSIGRELEMRQSSCGGKEINIEGRVVDDDDDSVT